MSACRSCGREIIWATSPAGRRLPLDARPVNPHVYRLRGHDETPQAEGVAFEAQGAVYVSHFLTCPNAAQHSKSGRI